MYPIALSLISLILVLAGQNFVYNRQNPVGPGLWLFAAAVILFIVADILSKKTDDTFSDYPAKPSKPVLMPGKAEIVFFIIIIAIAAYFRLYMITDLPPGAHRDEAKEAIDAVDMMNGRTPLGADSPLPVYMKAINDSPAMYAYLIAAFFKFLGPGVGEARIASAVHGILGVAAFYFLLRYLFGPITAIAGGFLFAVMRWDVHYSRIIYHAGFAIPILILCMYFLYRAYRERKWQDFALLGAMLALTQYTSHAARAVPFAVLATAVLVFIKDRAFYFENWKKLLLCLAVFTVVFFPLGSYIAKNWATFMSRPTGLFILGKEQVEQWKGKLTPLQLYLNNAKTVMLMYNRGGDPNVTYNIDGMPMVDFVTGALAVLGLGYILYRAFLLSWLALVAFGLFAVFVHGGILFIEAPHASRTILTLPFPVFFASVFIYKFFSYFRELGSKRALAVPVLITACLALFAARENYDIYFNRHMKSPYLFAGFDTAQNEAGKRLIALGDGWQGVFPPEYVAGDQITSELAIVLSKMKDKSYEQVLLWKNIPADPSLNKNFAYIFLPKYKTLIDVIKDIYPDAKFETVYRTYEPKEPALMIAEVPYAQIAAVKEVKYSNGLSAAYYAEGSRKPFLTRIDPVIEFDWYSGARPDERAFSAEWNGSIEAPAKGKYTFYLRSWDDSRLYIDGKQVCENEQPDKQWQAVGEIELSKGRHKIKISYKTINSFRMELLWRTPGMLYEEIVPYRSLYHN